MREVLPLLLAATAASACGSGGTEPLECFHMESKNVSIADTRKNWQQFTDECETNGRLEEMDNQRPGSHECANVKCGNSSSLSTNMCVIHARNLGASKEKKPHLIAGQYKYGLNDTYYACDTDGCNKEYAPQFDPVERSASIPQLSPPAQRPTLVPYVESNTNLYIVLGVVIGMITFVLLVKVVEIKLRKRAAARQQAEEVAEQEQQLATIREQANPNAAGACEGEKAETPEGTNKEPNSGDKKENSRVGEEERRQSSGSHRSSGKSNGSSEQSMTDEEGSEKSSASSSSCTSRRSLGGNSAGSNTTQREERNDDEN